MQIDTRTVTTKVHSASFSADDIKGVALAVVRKQLGLRDEAIVTSQADVGADGSVTVEVVEAVTLDAPAAPPTISADGPADPLADAPVAPTTDAPAQPAAPVLVPGFAKAA